MRWSQDKKMKYWSRKVQYKGKVFDSTHERDRFIYLQHLQKQGKITQLRRQVVFELIPQTTKTVEVRLKTKVRQETRVVEQNAAYTCDFLYIEDGKYICEEFKSEETAKLPDYILRRKLMIKKIYAHNERGRSRWIFREVIYYFKGGTTTTDK